MKKIAIVAVLIGFSGAINAQGLSLGYKTGVNNWLRINTTQKGAFIKANTDGDRVSWNNEVFVRYQTKGNLALEGGLSYTKRNTDGIAYIVPFDGNGWKEENINTSHTELNLGVQYKLNMPCGSQYPLLKKLTNYVGISVSPQLVNEVTEYTPNYTGTGIQPNTTRNGVQYLAISAGINHSMMYQINKLFNVITNVSFKYTPDGRYSSHPNTRVGISIGGSYNLN